MIDWNFIDAREGEELNGYVPDPAKSKSGVTIADGVDLSAWNATSLDGLPPDLLARLTPYFGLRRYDAQAALDAAPLTITHDEADALNAHVRGRAVAAITGAYDRASSVPFAAIPDQAQTVIASVSFQYGADLADRCPSFWSCATRQDWGATYNELMNFGDHYPSRRQLEAAYLKPVLG